jgi:hypothetical protein
MTTGKKEYLINYSKDQIKLKNVFPRLAMSNIVKLLQSSEFQLIDSRLKLQVDIAIFHTIKEFVIM